jgi:hypothetical protein
MRDWRKFVQSKLSELKLAAGPKKDVIDELTDHLEETYEDLRGRGFAEDDAAQRSLREVKDWHNLQRRIQTARMKESTMPNRVKQFWIPGFLAFVLSMGALALMQKFGPKPWVLVWSSHLPVSMLYIPWLLSLPLVGAIGAFLSHRAGGSQRAVLSSVVFPVLPFLVATLVVLPVSLILDHFIAHNIAPAALLMALLSWVLAPGVALLVGGLPVELLLSRRLSAR